MANPTIRAGACVVHWPPPGEDQHPPGRVVTNDPAASEIEVLPAVVGHDLWSAPRSEVRLDPLYL